MAQIFRRGSNVLSKASLLGLLALAGGGAIGAMLWYQSPYRNGVDQPVPQIVPFSHQDHVSGLGLDCRYCHSSVEDSSFAGMPPTHTCMTCHSQIWTGVPALEPVRDSYYSNTPLVWNQVAKLPDYVYFNHGIHVRQGIGCVTCHGRVDEMPRMRQAKAFTMSWCLACHRHPERYIRPRDRVFDMAWRPGRGGPDAPEEDRLPQSTLGPKLVKEYDIDVPRLTNCSVCHR